MRKSLGAECLHLKHNQSTAYIVQGLEVDESIATLLNYQVKLLAD